MTALGRTQATLRSGRLSGGGSQRLELERSSLREWRSWNEAAQTRLTFNPAPPAPG
jgi:hypothetical protein